MMTNPIFPRAHYSITDPDSHISYTPYVLPRQTIPWNPPLYTFNEEPIIVLTISSKDSNWLDVFKSSQEENIHLILDFNNLNKNELAKEFSQRKEYEILNSLPQNLKHLKLEISFNSHALNNLEAFRQLGQDQVSEFVRHLSSKLYSLELICNNDSILFQGKNLTMELTSRSAHELAQERLWLKFNNPGSTYNKDDTKNPGKNNTFTTKDLKDFDSISREIQKLDRGIRTKEYKNLTPDQVHALTRDHLTYKNLFSRSGPSRILKLRNCLCVAPFNFSTTLAELRITHSFNRISDSDVKQLKEIETLETLEMDESLGLTTKCFEFLPKTITRLFITVWSEQKEKSISNDNLLKLPAHLIRLFLKVLDQSRPKHDHQTDGYEQIVNKENYSINAKPILFDLTNVKSLPNGLTYLKCSLQNKVSEDDVRAHLTKLEKLERL